jgi:predicted Zn finger-like uncharacterized protein
MIITCPHCQTRYQLAMEAIGAAGRKVQCANCSRAWRARPELLAGFRDETEPLDAAAEDQLDRNFYHEDRGARPIASQRAAEDGQSEEDDLALMQMRQRAFSRRQNSMSRRMPLARFRRMARILALGSLVLVFGGGFLFRVQVVEHFPDLAGVYEAVGLGVNVVGLEFRNMDIVHTLRDGQQVLAISAEIASVTSDAKLVPPVIVTLFDTSGQPIYEWSVASEARDLLGGEVVDFETQLSQPPPEAVRVRLSFDGGRGPDREVQTEGQVPPPSVGSIDY